MEVGTTSTVVEWCMFAYVCIKGVFQCYIWVLPWRYITADCYVRSWDGSGPTAVGLSRDSAGRNNLGALRCAAADRCVSSHLRFATFAFVGAA